jgi:glycosyltransferase involved in cell wall biosynthesis
VDVGGICDAARSGPNLWTGQGPHLLAVGRLSAEKGFDLLIEALARVREQFPDVGLVIAGTGGEEAALRAQCRRLGLESAVQFAGQVDQPAAYFPGATLFVLCSRHEGLPNALLEAGAGGLPLVAMPASQGVVDLLDQQPGAWLAKEISASGLVEALLKALTALRPGERFAHAFMDEFQSGRALAAHEELLDGVLRERRL